MDPLIELLRRRHSDYHGPLGCRWWALCRDAADGAGGFRHAVEYASQDRHARGDWMDGEGESDELPGGSYLTRFDRETRRQFLGRLRTSHYRNHLKRVLGTYAGHLWRRPPERATTHAAVERWWRDTDGTGTTVLTWLRQGAREAHLHGWAAAYFDRDPVDGVASLATARTVARWLKPEEIVDWELASDGRFRWVRLCTVVCTRDPATGQESRREEYTTWTAAWWWRVTLATNAEGQLVVVANSGQVPHALGRVPVAVLYWEPRADIERLYATSHVAGAVSAALELFNVSSEARHVERGTAFPILYAQSANPKVFDNLKLGVHNGVVVEIDAKIPPGMFTAPPELSAHFEARRRELREDLYHAVSLDPPQADVTAPESGTARAYRFLGQRATLGAAAQQLAAFERECIELVVRWDVRDASREVIAQAQSVTSLTYPEDFDVQDAGSVLDTHQKVLDKADALAPVTVRASRLAIGRAINPQPTAESEKALTEQVEKLYERERDAVLNASTPPKEIFGYDLDLGAIPVNTYLASKGADPLPDGDMPIALWRAKYGLLPGQTPPAPTDPAAPGNTDPAAPGANGGGNGPAAGA